MSSASDTDACKLDVVTRLCSNVCGGLCRSLPCSAALLFDCVLSSCVGPLSCVLGSICTVAIEVSRAAVPERMQLPSHIFIGPGRLQITQCVTYTLWMVMAYHALHAVIKNVTREVVS